MVGVPIRCWGPGPRPGSAPSPLGSFRAGVVPPGSAGAPPAGRSGAWISHKTLHWISSEFGTFKFSNSYVSGAIALQGSGAPRDPPLLPLGVLGSAAWGRVFPCLRTSWKCDFKSTVIHCTGSEHFLQQALAWYSCSVCCPLSACLVLKWHRHHRDIIMVVILCLCQKLGVENGERIGIQLK